MASPNFIDYVKILFRSGSGGAGSVHFLRNAKTSKGGPDGGDGGKGGNIILRGNSHMWTLLHLKYRKHIYADNGGNGSRNNRYGADGEDIILDVPLGTIALDPDTRETLLEITYAGEEKILLAGGRGGQGNSHFATPTNQAPRYAQPGEPGVEAWIVLELKILADVGLVGFPNAGKSTLLGAITAATPRIADYPFTTLVPQLGIVSYHDNRSFVMADIPGIIEDAHQGKGLGLRFLRHIERNAVLLFMISCESDDICREFDILQNELVQYNPALADKAKLLAITKCDILGPEMIDQLRPSAPEGIPVVFISSVSGYGIQELKEACWQLLVQNPDHSTIPLEVD